MDTPYRKRVLEKIAKCMRLAEDSRGDANTAAIAMRQAQAMMAKHSVTEAEILGYISEQVECPVQAGPKSPCPIQLSRLVVMVRQTLGVRAVIDKTMRVSDYGFTIRYFGPADRVAIACYTHVVLYREMETAWKIYLINNPQHKGIRGMRASFQVGWLAEVRSKVEDFAFGPGETDAIDKVMDEFYGQELAVAKPRTTKIYSDSKAAGAAAAGSFSINRPMSGAKNRMLTGG